MNDDVGDGLDKLCREEPYWAANRIRTLTAEHDRFELEVGQLRGWVGDLKTKGGDPDKLVVVGRKFLKPSLLSFMGKMLPLSSGINNVS